jgi:hypothetical protein
MLQIDTNDKKSIKELLDIAKNKLHLNIFIVEEKSNIKAETQTKWGKFSQKMDGLFTPEIIQHISVSRKEARDNFIANI